MARIKGWKKTGKRRGPYSYEEWQNVAGTQILWIYPLRQFTQKGKTIKHPRQWSIRRFYPKSTKVARGLGKSFPSQKAAIKATLRYMRGH